MYLLYIILKLIYFMIQCSVMGLLFPFLLLLLFITYMAIFYSIYVSIDLPTYLELLTDQLTYLLASLPTDLP